MAEGVESATQAEQLARIGCDLAQGFYWSRPLPAEELEHWLDQHSTLTPRVPAASSG